MEKDFKEELEIIATLILAEKIEIKPNYTNRDFMNCVIIFMSALMDKVCDLQDNEDMDIEERLNMANSVGQELRKLIHTYTGLDTHDSNNFI